MKAIIWTEYGPPELLQLKEIPKPQPKPDEVLIKTRASTVTAGDCEMRRFDIPGWIWLPIRLYFGLFRPRIKVLGQELAGEIEEVGSEVRILKPGDAVFVSPGMTMGGYAEYITVSQKMPMAQIPQNMTFEEAATIPTGGINGLHFVRKGKLKSGEKLLIIGAGGSIGTYALQIAKDIGADVTCVDSEEKLEMLRDLGAEEVIDYKRDDFTKLGNKYDVIIDITGKISTLACMKVLNSGGRLVLGNPRVGGMLLAIWTSFASSKKAIVALASEKVVDFLYLKEMIERGAIKAVIEKSYPLEEVPEAHRYVETGRKAGNVVINIS